MRRVGLLEACDDERLFGVPLTEDQRARLARVEDTRTSVWAVGRRGLKTTSAAYVALWSCLLRPELRDRLRPGERGYAVGVATSHRQARLLLAAARAVVERSPLLAGLVESETEDEIVFAGGMAFAAFPATSRGSRGWPVHTLLFDELAHFVDNDGNVSADSVVRALLPATAQFGDDARVIASSTPWGSEGTFATWHAQAASGELEDAYAHHATTEQANPTIDPAFLASEQARDPDSFRSEYLAEFVGSGGAFFDSHAIGNAATLGGELNPNELTDVVIGLDPAFSASDRFAAVVIGRDKREHERLVVGAVRSWQADERPASLDEARAAEDTVLAEVAAFIRRWNGRAITDQYRASGVAERLRRFGIQVRVEPMTASTKSSAFGFTRARLNEGTLELPEHADLLRELRAARARYAAGRSSVVLPRIGGGHCDLAQALAIGIYEHDRQGLHGPAGIYPPSWNGRELRDGAPDPYAGVPTRVADALARRLHDTRFRPSVRGATRR